MFAFQLLRSLSRHLRAPWPWRKGRRALRPAAVPNLESLEGRDVPSAFGNQVFVATLYQGFLGRAADPGGLAFWSGALNSGSTPLQVASGIFNSAEFRGREVAGLFQPLLGRAPDLGGLNAFAGALGGVTSPAQVAATILASDEFFSRAGGTPLAFVNAVFQNVLDRPPDPQALAVFGGLAGTGFAGRLGVASQVLGSGEALGDKLSLFYLEVLGRPVDPLGLDFWTSALRSGARDEAVLAGLVSSAEFVGRVESASLFGVDANQVASQFIASNALFGLALPFLTSTPPETAALVLSPPLGIFAFPAGFNGAAPAATLGAFGQNGFLPFVPLLSQGFATATTGIPTSPFNFATSPGNLPAGFSATNVIPFTPGPGLTPTIVNPFPVGPGLTPIVVNPFPVGSGLIPTVGTPFTVGSGVTTTGIVPINAAFTGANGLFNTIGLVPGSNAFGLAPGSNAFGLAPGSNTFGLVPGSNSSIATGFSGTTFVIPNAGIGTFATPSFTSG